MNEKQKLEKSLSIWDDAIVLQFLFYSTVTDFAKFLGLSGSKPFNRLT